MIVKEAIHENLFLSTSETFEYGSYYMNHIVWSILSGAKVRLIIDEMELIHYQYGRTPTYAFDSHGS